MDRLAFIGVGEAATAIVSGWKGRGEVTGHDIKDDAEMRARFARHGIARAASDVEAVAGAVAVFSTVTADQAVLVAEGVAQKPVAVGELMADPPEALKAYLGR